MSGISLYDYQREAVQKMKNGCILCGGVGSGKSRTALAYYYLQEGGILGTEEYYPMSDPPRDLYIITTARKRDTLEWEGELSPFLLSTNPELDLYRHKTVVDSWNNIGKYADVTGAYFIFDEQRVVGNGAWVKSFLKIARANKWILLSATPGDTWTDYIPVFIANGFYRNRSDFIREHVVYKPFTRYPQIDHYVNRGKLLRERNEILVSMDFKRETVPHHEDIYVPYDVQRYKTIVKKRWNVWDNQPIQNASAFCYVLRRCVNSDGGRLEKILEICNSHPRVIIFYNFDYELEILKTAPYGRGVKVAEWNGHRHDPIPRTKKWIYLVQYAAGAEGWNCTETDTIIFYSQNYSYKTMIQASGRIDRVNTPYADLYYYHLKSRSGIDLAISRALKEKRKFNETAFYARN